MSLPLNADQVVAMAPDVAAAAAGRKLATARSWQGLGIGERAIWGECQGSALYQTQVSLKEFGNKCSCPSRKFPCKHVLGLMLLAATTPGALTAEAEPEWVAAWFSKRQAAATRKETKHTEGAKPVDAAAQAKRVAQRHDRILKGLDQLDAWLEDLVRQGLGRLEKEAPSFWEQQAKRLIDAQAPGIATRIRRLAELPRSSPDWSAELLQKLGVLMLASQAFRRIEELEEPHRQDLRHFIGFTVERDSVIAEGERVPDVWMLLAQSVDDEDHIRVQRTWLRGSETGRDALIVQFAPGTDRFPEAMLPGTQFQAELAFYASAHPLRAVVDKRQGQATPLLRFDGSDGFEQLLDSVANAVSRQPWLDVYPASIRSVVPVAKGERRILLRDAKGVAAPLTPESHDRLLAVSGGHPVDVAGEWDGFRLRPLAAWVDSRYVLLRGSAHA